MSAQPLQNEVLAELGDDRIQEIAGVLGTDPESARKLVGTSVTSLTGVLTDDGVTPGGTAELSQALEQAATEPEPAAGENGNAGHGGATAAGGMLVAVLSKVTAPAARAVAKKTGLPVPAVTGALELVIPVVATVLAKRARTTR